MKYLLVLSLLVITACGKKGTTEESPTCAHDVSAEMITYADGVSRKSEVTNCTYPSGKACLYASFVNDPTVTYSSCK